MKEGHGVCPVCNGSGRVPCPDALRPYNKSGWYGYKAEDDCVECRNCGAQYMFTSPTGQVKLNKEGVPCTHEYTVQTVGRCYHEHTCKHCGDVHHIDSGD